MWERSGEWLWTEVTFHGDSVRAWGDRTKVERLTLGPQFTSWAVVPAEWVEQVHPVFLLEPTLGLAENG